MAIPAKHKMRGRTGKLLLRDVGARVLPVAIPAGKKGFSLPLDAWLRGELQEPVRETLSPGSPSERAGIFDPAAVSAWSTGCLAGDDRLGASGDDALQLRAVGAALARRRAAPAQDGRRARETASAPPRPDLSVIIVNWNTLERLRALPRVRRGHLARVDHEVIVVDNASSDGSPAMVEREFPGRAAGRATTENVGFGRANNQAMRMAHGEWFLLLNRDTILIDDSVAELVRTGPRGAGHRRRPLPADAPRRPHPAQRLPFPEPSGSTLIESLGLYKLMPRRTAGPTLLSGYWDYAEETRCRLGRRCVHADAAAVFDRDGRFRRALVHVRRGPRVVLPDSRAGLAHPLLTRRRRSRTSTMRAPSFAGATSESPSAAEHPAGRLSRTARRGASRAPSCRVRADRRIAAARLLLRSPSLGAREPSATATCSATRASRVRALVPLALAAPMTWPYYGNSRPDIQRLRRCAGVAVLDVGCGEGALSARAESGRCRARGRHRARSAAAAVARAAPRRARARATCATVALPFASGEFDYLLFADVLEHLPDPDAVLERLLPS